MIPNRSAGDLRPVLGEGGLCDPLKGWARKDTTLPDTLSIQQAGVDGTGLQPAARRDAADDVCR